MNFRCFEVNKNEIKRISSFCRKFKHPRYCVSIVCKRNKDIKVYSSGTPLHNVQSSEGVYGWNEKYGGAVCPK